MKSLLPSSANLFTHARYNKFSHVQMRFYILSSEHTMRYDVQWLVLLSRQVPAFLLPPMLLVGWIKF